MSNRRPFLVVVSAPSGCGKTTILQQVLERLDGLGVSVSHTTRLPRMGETVGVDYHFVDSSTFSSMVEAGDFIEYATVHSNSYGTSSAAIETLLGRGVDVVLDIDVQGMQLLKSDPRFELVSIFVLPPSLVVLEERLRNRNSDSDLVVSRRIKNAVHEIALAPAYDYNVINDDLSVAVDDVLTVIRAERLRSIRMCQ